MTKDDIKVEGQAGLIGQELMVVVVDSPSGKEYRLPTEEEYLREVKARGSLDRVFSKVPFGLPRDPITADGKGSTWCIQYGMTTFETLFTPRQLVAIGTLIHLVREAHHESNQSNYPEEWSIALISYLQLAIDRFVSFCCSLVRWKVDAEAVVDAFARFGLPLLWDFAEAIPVNQFAGGFQLCMERVCTGLQGTINGGFENTPDIRTVSAIKLDESESLDAIVTDPPYYDAISYSAIMDFFYIWLRRGLFGIREEFTFAFREPLAPKWSHEEEDGELIDDAKRFGGDRQISKSAYENGMARAFEACHRALRKSGQLVIVFANKQPDAWETLAAAIIRAGFVVDGSWPIQTEMANRARALTSAALASSVWLVCKKRSISARPGWDNIVLEEMRKNISVQLREFWDAGIRGPDFVWAATGPAMEAYSKHPVVRKANEPNATMSVGEFLNHVRRMVVDYVVGQVLSGVDTDSSDGAAVGNLDEVTAYYLLHRHDFGINEAPIGACILYATACGLSDTELERTWDILSGGGGDSKSSEDDEDIDSEDSDSESEADPDADSGTGSKVRLKAWNQRRSKSMGYDAPEGKAVPLIDRIHRLMHLWKDGDLQKVDEYIDEHALRRYELFKRVVQSLIELSTNSERSTLESISNHIGAKGAVRDRGPTFDFGDDE